MDSMDVDFVSGGNKWVCWNMGCPKTPWFKSLKLHCRRQQTAQIGW